MCFIISVFMIDLKEILARAGLVKGSVVLDFGCGEGTYTIPAAYLVGRAGKVYALDMDAEPLKRLRRKIHLLGLGNIIIIETSGELAIPLSSKTLDYVLLFDVLHSWYFPESDRRLRLLGEVHRVLKPEGRLIFYPGDPEVFNKREELEAILREISASGFKVEEILSENLIHEGTIVKGHIYRFKKTI